MAEQSSPMSAEVSFPRWWVEQMRDQMFALGNVPGKAGDCIFLWREMLKDKLESATPEAPGDVAEIVRERQALSRMVYEAVRFANWAAGEGFCPAAGEPALDPAEFLTDYVTAIGGDDYEGLAEVVRDVITEAQRLSAVNVQRDSDIGILLSALRMHEEAVGESFDDDGGNVAQIEADYRDRVG